MKFDALRREEHARLGGRLAHRFEVALGSTSSPTSITIFCCSGVSFFQALSLIQTPHVGPSQMVTSTTFLATS
jgi:hypothetical protein